MAFGVFDGLLCNQKTKQTRKISLRHKKGRTRQRVRPKLLEEKEVVSGGQKLWRKANALNGFAKGRHVVGFDPEVCNFNNHGK